MKESYNISKILSQVIEKELESGYSIRVGVLDYNDLVLVELDKIEHFSSKYNAEFNCLSKCIRKYIWKENTGQLYNVLRCLNKVFERVTSIWYPEMLWELDTIISYVNLLFKYLNIRDTNIYNKIVDSIQVAGAKETIEKQWENVLTAQDGSRAFIDMFDDLFKNAITKYETDFICTIEETDVLCRMVKEKSCNEERFVPWPNKVQNRWNPPGKTYLYLSYGKTEGKYNTELTLCEYVCLLECKLEGETDTCFCRFRPTVKGRVLDLSYNDIELYKFRQDIEERVEKQSRLVAEIVLQDKDIIKHGDDREYIQKRIEDVMAAEPLGRDFIEKNSAKQILKLICSCIYKKVNEKDEAALEKAYRSFQILSGYLEKNGVTGIIYPCTRTDKIRGKNLVLFDINDAVPIAGSIKQYHFEGKYD